jgi:hypothetical protein
MKNYLKQSTNSIICAFICQGSAYGQIVNVATDRQVTLVIVADATFTAKQMPIPIGMAYSISGTGVVTSQSLSQAVNTDYLAYDFKTTFPGLNPALLITDDPEMLAYISTFFFYYSVATAAVEAYQEFVVSDHTMVNLYQFLIPSDGYYDITYWVPGDWDKPASDVYVTSYANDGVHSQTLFSQDAVSDRTLTNHVFLRQGLNYVKIDVGSGTVLTHNAGYLVSVALNDTVNRTWTVPGFPVNALQCNLSNIISSSIGGTRITSIVYNPPSNPLNITNGLATTYANPACIFSLPENPPVYQLKFNKGSSADVFEECTEPDATITFTFQNNIGIFSTLRLNDYQYGNRSGLI